MAKALFDTFIGEFEKTVRRRFPFIEPNRASLGAVLPKKSSFYLGISPKFGKHVIVAFQQSKKTGEKDDFSINVHISQSLELTDNFAPFRRAEFFRFEDGFYRLPTMIGKDRWWCLSGREQVSSLVDHWVPPEGSTAPVTDAVEDVLDYLSRYVFEPGGFISEVEGELRPESK